MIDAADVTKVTLVIQWYSALIWHSEFQYVSLQYNDCEERSRTLLILLRAPDQIPDRFYHSQYHHFIHLYPIPLYMNYITWENHENRNSIENLLHTTARRSKQNKIEKKSIYLFIFDTLSECFFEHGRFSLLSFVFPLIDGSTTCHCV